MKYLYIDDERETPIIPNTDVHRTRTYHETIQWLDEFGCPDMISFDHDLGLLSKGSGKDIANWLIDRDLDEHGTFIPKDFKFNVHSANPPGAENIKNLLGSYLDFKVDAEL